MIVLTYQSHSKITATLRVVIGKICLCTLKSTLGVFKPHEHSASLPSSYSYHQPCAARSLRGRGCFTDCSNNPATVRARLLSSFSPNLVQMDQPRAGFLFLGGCSYLGWAESEIVSPAAGLTILVSGYGYDRAVACSVPSVLVRNKQT
ncbi:uncharacterized protein BO97DRAFT_180832 [Aspergillus homomorphus CBS 101889]|uniref:Uncharacterized protein n=1 Tax=Aspergillus homomorphus (strain CBS 101889) TaxID=1450537 RepID=A0A395I782_ASPHC|nr:hypothetical protein BO97DRAFT_180832 [Aspergillus homomorphus CBS 101889]RAL16072.1 hypothetical protein BO97DRAFT_180832 [Aspergillus homomorphus CBS 101889]